MHEIEPHRFKVESRWRCQLRINRHQIILPGDLQTMTCIKEEPDFGSLQSNCEVANPSVECSLVQVEAIDDLKAVLLECRTNVLSIALWVF